MLLMVMSPLPTVSSACSPLTQIPTASLKPELTYSRYSSDENTTCIVSVLPSGTNSASKTAASKVACPEIALSPASPEVKLAVEVPDEVLASPEALVMSEARPVDRITPLSDGATPGAALSPCE